MYEIAQNNVDVSGRDRLVQFPVATAAPNGEQL